MKAVERGISSALIISITGIVMVIGWILVDEGTNYYLPDFVVILGITSIFIGGLITGLAKTKDSWWYQGIVMGIGYLAICFLTINLLFPVFITINQVLTAMSLLIAAIIGTFIGHITKPFLLPITMLKNKGHQLQRAIFDKKS